MQIFFSFWIKIPLKMWTFCEKISLQKFSWKLLLCIANYTTKSSWFFSRFPTGISREIGYFFPFPAGNSKHRKCATLRRTSYFIIDFWIYWDDKSKLILHLYLVVLIIKNFFSFSIYQLEVDWANYFSVWVGHWPFIFSPGRL